MQLVETDSSGDTTISQPPIYPTIPIIHPKSHTRDCLRATKAETKQEAYKSTTTEDTIDNLAVV